MKTDMEKAMACVVDIFHQYCILSPIDDYLQRAEFDKLMKEQAQPFLKKTQPPNLDQKAYLDQLFKKADKNHDAKLKFTEWATVLGLALNEAHDRSHDLGSDGGSGGHCHSHGDGSVHCH
ncbi:protein S100-A9-like isoform X1 [Anolis carolinensis]|uniref:protein S100-A9-like isoform X1 n=1 Tax=Anolis carolinensis TaxID=28377 RepID=UPI002F2B4629